MNNKEKVMVFFSDIAGTFTTKKEKNTYIKEFINLLENKARQLGLQRVIFCFVTGDDRSDFLIKNIDILKKYNESDFIKLGLQFYSNGELELLKNNQYIKHSSFKEMPKNMKISKYLDFLKCKYNIKQVLFADDYLDLNDYYNLISEINNSSIDIKVLIPGYQEVFNKNVLTSRYYGINGLIDCLGQLKSEEKSINYNFIDDQKGRKK